MLGEVIGAAPLLLELIYGHRGLLHYRSFPNSIYLIEAFGSLPASGPSCVVLLHFLPVPQC